MAVENITMPQLGESPAINSFTIPVKEDGTSAFTLSVITSASGSYLFYDPLAEVMTDKVNAEVPSSFTGIVKELIAGEGDTHLLYQSLLLQADHTCLRDRQH
jgi:2-oxoisovalerate dehydrogenase E2 component (dihydrolipoyl transacylase)